MRGNLFHTFDMGCILVFINASCNSEVTRLNCLDATCNKESFSLVEHCSNWLRDKTNSLASDINLSRTSTGIRTEESESADATSRCGSSIFSFITETVSGAFSITDVNGVAGFTASEKEVPASLGNTIVGAITGAGFGNTIVGAITGAGFGLISGAGVLATGALPTDTGALVQSLSALIIASESELPSF